MISPKELFKRKFKRIKKTGCIIFRKAGANKERYPVIKRNGKQYRYGRYLWTKAKGPIPDGLVLRHICDNPACVNLNHLILGTITDNVADRVARNRSAIGERNGRAKLTEGAVRFIRDNNTLNQKELARIYHVDQKSIQNIKSGRLWKHVTV